MTKKIDISGKWLYKEDFGYGVDTGYAILEQENDRVTGFIKYTEQIEGDITFMIKQQVEGDFDGLTLRIKGVAVETMPLEEAEGYSFDVWEGSMANPKKISGKSVDETGIYGNFTFIKEDL